MKMLGRTYWGWACCSRHDPLGSGYGRSQEKASLKSEIEDELYEDKEFLDWYYGTKQEREDFLNELEALNQEARQLRLDKITIVWQD